MRRSRRAVHGYTLAGWWMLVAAVSSLASPEPLFQGLPVQHPGVRSFDLGDPVELGALGTMAEHLAAQACAQALTNDLPPAAHLTADALKRLYAASSSRLGPRDAVGLEEIARLARAAAAAPADVDRAALIASLREVAAALRNARRPPAPRRIADVCIPAIMIDQAHNPVGPGGPEAASVQPAPGEPAGKWDPPASTFWAPRTNIQDLDLFHGFGVQRTFDWTQPIWTYAAPKTGYGGNPGWEATARGVRVRVKAAETRSEPFAARLFWAMGYHVDPTYHAASMKLRYDRRWFLEFNVRRDLEIVFAWLGLVPVYTLNLQKHHDPLTSIQAAVLIDGTRWSPDELRRALFLDPQRTHPETDPVNYRPEIESRIDYLVSVPVNLQPKDPGLRTLGPWTFGEMGHEDRRELRGLALLAAWVGWYDARWANTKLRLDYTSGTSPALRHMLSDLGGCLGRGTGYFSGREELPNEFAWTCTNPPIRRGRNRMTTPFRITHFKPIEDNPAFEAMTLEDARWMARRIGQLTEAQLCAALIGAGFDSATGRLYLEKLVHRRDRLVRDLGLGEEISPLRPGGVSQTLDYDPAREGPLVAQLPSGKRVEASLGNHSIRHGVLVTRP